MFYFLSRSGMASNVMVDSVVDMASNVLADSFGDSGLVYPMPTGCKGFFLIFSNGKFPESSGCSDLSATNRKDVGALNHVFGGLLGFNVQVYEDMNETQIMAVLDMYARKDHSAYGCFGCFFLSHGANGVVCDREGNGIKVGRIFAKFGGQKFLQMPKLFFFDVCRKGAAGEPVGDCGFNTVYAYACSEGYYSYCTENGSRYTTTLCEAIETRFKNEKKRDILTILTVVNQLMEKSKGKYQCPAPISTLTKKLYLY